MNRIQVIIKDDIGNLDEETISEKLINERLRSKANVRAELIIRAKASILGISDEQVDEYLINCKEKITFVKIYDSQNGDKIEAGFIIEYPELDEFINSTTIEVNSIEEMER